MNEEVMGQVIGDYATENANLKIRVATLQLELNKALKELEEIKSTETTKEEK